MLKSLWMVAILLVAVAKPAEAIQYVAASLECANKFGPPCWGGNTGPDWENCQQHNNAVYLECSGGRLPVDPSPRPESLRPYQPPRTETGLVGDWRAKSGLSVRVEQTLGSSGGMEFLGYLTFVPQPLSQYYPQLEKLILRASSSRSGEYAGTFLAPSGSWIDARFVVSGDEMISYHPEDAKVSWTRFLRPNTPESGAMDLFNDPRQPRPDTGVYPSEPNVGWVPSDGSGSAGHQPQPTTPPFSNPPAPSYGPPPGGGQAQPGFSAKFRLFLAVIEQHYFKPVGWTAEQQVRQQPANLAGVLGHALGVQFRRMERDPMLFQEYQNLEREVQGYLSLVEQILNYKYPNGAPLPAGELWNHAIMALRGHHDVQFRQVFGDRILQVPEMVQFSEQQAFQQLAQAGFQAANSIELLRVIAPEVHVERETRTDNRMPPKPEISYDAIGGVWIDPKTGEAILEFRPGGQAGQYVGRYLKNMNLMANPHEPAKPSSLCLWVTNWQGPYNGVVGNGIAHQGDMIFNNQKVSTFSAGIYWLYSSNTNRWVQRMDFVGRTPNALWSLLEYRLEKR